MKKKGTQLILPLILLLLVIIPFQKHENTLNNPQPGTREPMKERTPGERRSERVEPQLSINKNTEHQKYNRITILNDSAFGPIGYNFPGTGTANDPYLIEGYNITDSSGTLIHIENTIVCFIIQDCILDGISKAHKGIYLHNVTQGTIFNNVLRNNYQSCYLYDSDYNNTIENNWISNTADVAIGLSNSRNNGVFDNEIQNSHRGIYVAPYSPYSQIFRNTITDVLSDGVYIGSDSSHSDVINNTLSNIGGNGVVLSWWTRNHEIRGNLISNTSGAGIVLSSTNYGGGAIISNNNILNSKHQGILFAGSNSGVPITRNTIVNCAGYGIQFNTSSDNNEVTWNTFLHNNGGGTQAYDNGTNNVFEYNHWNDHVGPDTDTDGFVDSGYSIVNGNTDLHPRVAPIWINDNSDFMDFALSGNGTEDNPYKIKGHHFISNKSVLIAIYNTTAYFVIENCHLDGINEVHTGIFLYNVTSGTMSHNILSNNVQCCYLYRSHYNIIENNWLSNTSSTSIVLTYSGHNGIFDNEIHNSGGHGIDVSPYSGSNQIFRNTIIDIALNGVHFKSDSSHGDAINNTLSNIEGYGVNVEWNTIHHEIIGNLISNTSLAGIRLASTGAAGGYRHGATISNNTILNSKQQGIQLIGENYDVPITRNTIFNCTGYGLEINTNSDDNEVKWNNFFHNNGGGTQAFDNGTNNVFEYNHWNDYVGPDVDTDGFVDSNYQINGGLGALKFTGSDVTYFYLFDPITFASDAITVELWMKWSGWSFFAWNSSNLISYYTDGQHYAFLMGYNDSADEFMIYVADGALSTGCSLSENTWTHLVVTWRSSDGETTLWKDGILRYTGNVSKGLTLDSGGSPFLLMGIDFNWNQEFDGILDEVRFFNRTLNQSEIQADYNAGAPYPVRSGTIGWYHFDDSGNTATDSAGGMGDGTLYNGWEWVDGIGGNFDPYPRVTPIWINDNSHFLNFSCSGTGTSNDPYIIEKQYFLSNRTPLIYIKNTDVHFEIRNSIFNGLNGSNDLIYLDDVNNGHIIDNTITNSANNAIWIKGSSNNNIISENNIYDCGSGIRLIGSGSNNIISENRIYNLVAAHGTGISVDYGAYSNTITGNIIFGSWTYNNRMHGIIVGQSANQNNFSLNTIYNCSYNGFYIATSAHHNTYSENNISHCGGYGIFTWMGTHNDTFSNNIIYNTSTGIALDNSSSNTLSGNTIFNCTEGIWVFGFSIFNNISTNMIYNNTDYGIDLGESSENNDVEWNNILDNNQTGGCQAYDEGIANTFRYNYWDDWISPDEDGDGFVDDPYNIDGGDNQDLFPRATQVPVVTIVSPLAQIYRTRITVILAGNAFLFKYYIAGVDSSNQTWSVSTNRTLGDSTYTLHVFGFDPIDKYTTHESVSFTIDSTPPNIEILSPLSTTYRQKSLSLIYSISDITEIQTTIYVDGVSNTSSIPSGFTSSFPDGSYNITIIAVDQVGNIGVASVFFTVDTKPPNISIDSPTTTIYVTGSIMITLSGDDDVINYWYYIVGVDSVNQTWASAITRSLPNGSYTLHAYGNDSAGNEGHVSVTFIVEIPPTTPTSTAPTTTPPTTTTDGAKPADDLGTLIGLGIIVFGTLAVGFLFLRRRGRGPPDASVPPEVTDTPDKLEE